MAALQHLPARQRAVLILRDVLAWRAAEVADLLEITTAAVNSALQRARAQLHEAAPSQHSVARTADREQREMADRYLSAFLRADVAALSRLLADEVVLEMPPFLNWYRGRETVAAFLAARALAAPDRWRAIPVGANAQPAAGLYLRRDDGLPPRAIGPGVQRHRRRGQLDRRVRRTGPVRDVRPAAHFPS